MMYRVVIVSGDKYTNLLRFGFCVRTKLHPKGRLPQIIFDRKRRNAYLCPLKILRTETDMDLNALKSDLELLARIVGGWSADRDIAAIERDLVLEKLRRLYETVYSDAAETVSEPVAPLSEPDAVGRSGEAATIDLGAVLSLDALPDAPEPEPEPEPEQKPEAEPVPAEMPGWTGEIAAPMETPVSVEREDAPAAETPVPDEREDMPAAEESVSVGEVAAPAGTEDVPALGSVADPAGISPAAAPVESAAPAVSAEPVAPAAPAGEPEPAADGAPRVPKRSDGPAPESLAVPTLFGPEEATRRHRHKQRLIMSLYDTASETAASERSGADASSARRTELPENPAWHAAVRTVQPESVPSQREAAAGAEAPADRPEPEKRPSRPLGGAVLGEVIGHERRTLADTIAAPRDRTSELLRNEPVGDLHRAIGINDRFLLIRDLFGGDAGAFERAVDALNDCPSLDDCMIHIAENYAWNPNSDGAQLMMELLERKFA